MDSSIPLRTTTRGVFYFTIFIFLLFTNHLNAQASATGTLSNYDIFCSNTPSCSNNGPLNATYFYQAPTDGQLMITGFAAAGVINCCGNSNQMTCSGSFRKVNAPANIHNFSTQPTTGLLDCVAAGDLIEINFSGSFGTYGYTAMVIPDPIANDAEPNQLFSQAIDIQDGANHTGHLSYGAYTVDNRDRYMYVAKKIGTLQLHVTSSDHFTIQTYRNDSIFVGSEQLNISPYIFQTSCLAIDDTVFLQMNGFTECMNYEFDAEFIEPAFGNDQEPNNTINTAIESVNIFGSIGYGRVSPVIPDNKDFFALPYLKIGDEMTFEIEVLGGPVVFRIRSQTFSGFTFSLGTITDNMMTSSFLPTFDDQFYLEAFTSTGNCGDYIVSLGGCVKELFLTGQESNTMEIGSDSFIISDQHLQSMAIVDYDAKHFITLEANFQVQVGGVFHAFIDGCSP